jgi:hypothetical protein
VAEPDLARDRFIELRGRTWHQWLRRGLLALFAALCIVALFDAFGQRSTTSSATTREAFLGVDGPPRLRGGLLYQVRFTLRPLTHAVSHPKLLLSQNWFDEMTLNDVTPSPAAENSRGGRFAFEFPALGRGKTLTVLTAWQVIPVAPGRRSLTASFVDGNRPLATVHRTLTIFP